MTEQDIQDAVRNARNMLHHVEKEHFDTDQQLKKPQPPLFKASSGGKVIRLTKDFSELKRENDLVRLLYARRSHRVYTEEGMTLSELAFLLWAQQGVKSIRGSNYATLRVVPSGGGRHPFEAYCYVRRVAGLQPGLYHYLSDSHSLEMLSEDAPGLPEQISEALCRQKWALKGDVIFFYSILPYRGEWRYSFEAERVMLMDLGYAGENLYLAAAALGKGTCAIAAVRTDLASRVFGLDGEEEFILYAAPVGSIREEDNEAAEQAFYAFLNEQKE